MIYLDHSATTKPYKEVLDTYVKVSSQYFGNPSSLHQLGLNAEKLLSKSRNQIASLLNIKEKEVYFTSGGTEGNNLAIKGTAMMYRNRGKHIITTAIEHPSVRETCLQLKELGFEITFLPVDHRGLVQLDALKKELREDTILVSIMHVNNEIGVVQPIHEIGQLLKQYPKVLFHVDLVQGIGKVPISFKDCGIDIGTISGHKFHGLKGTGILYIREGVKISPILTGGEQERKLRSGTENVGGFVALAKALRLSFEKMDEKINEMKKIKQYFMSELKKLEGVIVHTPENFSAPHIINFSVEGFKGEVFVHALEEHNIFVSTTSACSSKLDMPSKTLLAMGVTESRAKGAIRISLGYENTLDEAKFTMNKIKETIQHLSKVMRGS